MLAALWLLLFRTNSGIYDSSLQFDGHYFGKIGKITNPCKLMTYKNDVEFLGAKSATLLQFPLQFLGLGLIRFLSKL